MFLEIKSQVCNHQFICVFLNNGFDFEELYSNGMDRRLNVIRIDFCNCGWAVCFHLPPTVISHMCLNILGADWVTWYTKYIYAKSHRRLISTLNFDHFTRSAQGPEGSGAASGNRRLQQTQAQVDEVRYVSDYTDLRVPVRAPLWTYIFTLMMLTIIPKNVFIIISIYVCPAIRNTQILDFCLSFLKSSHIRDHLTCAKVNHMIFMKSLDYYYYDYSLHVHLYNVFQIQGQFCLVYLSQCTWFFSPSPLLSLNSSLSPLCLQPLCVTPFFLDVCLEQRLT